MKVFLISKKTLYCIAAVLALAAAAVLILLFSKGSGDPVKGKRTAFNVSVPVSGDTASGGDRTDCYELEVFAGLMKELPVYSVDRSDKKIALTIDAAWQDDKTPFILETLDKYGIKATFFLCGFWVEEHPDMVRRIAEAGHEIGNHSMTHPHMSKLTAAQIREELAKFEAAAEPILGRRTVLFRAPYGEYNDNVIKTLREEGYEVIQWNIDTIDWREERSANDILNTVLPKLADGSIILSHNNGYRIEQYLPTLIETALARGYTFVTVSELLLSGNTAIDVNGVQKIVS